MTALPFSSPAHNNMAIDDIWMRFMENMVARVSGPMRLRLLLQPTMAAIFAIRSGLKDSHEGRPAFLWTVISDPSSRDYLIKDGWKSISKVFLIAMALDIIYQLVVARFIYPLEVVVTAFLLAIVPYICLRGLTTRITRK
jgi:hypothetical protein